MEKPNLNVEQGEVNETPKRLNLYSSFHGEKNIELTDGKLFSVTENGDGERENTAEITSEEALRDIESKMKQIEHEIEGLDEKIARLKSKLEEAENFKNLVSKL